VLLAVLVVLALHLQFLVHQLHMLVAAVQDQKPTQQVLVALAGVELAHNILLLQIPQVARIRVVVVVAVTQLLEQAAAA